MSYATVAQLRAMDGLDDAVTYPDQTLQDGIDFATELIDDYCGTSFEPKAFTVALEGNGGGNIFIDVLFVQTITTLKIDGVTVAGGNFNIYPWGTIKSTNVFFPYGSVIEFTGTAGMTATAPKRIAWAARTIARDYCLNLHSRLPSRALSVTNDLGQIEVRAQAGGPGRPTNMPDVNAVLNSPQFKHKR